MSKPRASDWTPHDGDVLFYQDQMRAIERDVASGMVAPTDSAGSRTEIGRRLIAAADRAAPVAVVAGRRRRLFAAAILVTTLVPLLSVGLYLHVGTPAEPDLPLLARQTNPNPNDLDGVIARVEDHLAAHPTDGRGFELLAPLYLRLGRYDDAVRAYDRVLDLVGETGERRAAYGQALMLQADGVITAAARAQFQKALADDPKLPQPQYYLGIAAEQDGDKARARDLWTGLVAQAPADAPWLPAVQSRLAALDGKPLPQPPAGSPPSGPSSPAGAAIAALPDDQRLNAIHGMVDGLAARLAQNGQDKEGWLRLVRAYAVLGEKDKAMTALADARKNLSADAQGLTQLEGLAHELGLEG